MASEQNRFRVAAEVDAAAIGVRAAALIGDDKDVASARSRLERAETAHAAIEQGISGDLSPGQPILWINTFGAGSGDEPIGILKGRIVGEGVPRELASDHFERRYLALIETRWGAREHMVGEDDVIAVPNRPQSPDVLPGRSSGAEIAELIDTTFGDTEPDIRTSHSDMPPPPQQGPGPDLGVDP